MKNCLTPIIMKVIDKRTGYCKINVNSQYYKILIGCLKVILQIIKIKIPSNFVLVIYMSTHFIVPCLFHTLELTKYFPKRQTIQGQNYFLNIGFL